MPKNINPISNNISITDTPPTERKSIFRPFIRGILKEIKSEFIQWHESNSLTNRASTDHPMSSVIKFNEARSEAEAIQLLQEVGQVKTESLTQFKKRCGGAFLEEGIRIKRDALEETVSFDVQRCTFILSNEQKAQSFEEVLEDIGGDYSFMMLLHQGLFAEAGAEIQQQLGISAEDSRPNYLIGNSGPMIDDLEENKGIPASQWKILHTEKGTALEAHNYFEIRSLRSENYYGLIKVTISTHPHSDEVTTAWVYVNKI